MNSKARTLLMVTMSATLACDSSELTELRPIIEVSPSAIEFVGTHLGLAQKQRLTISNKGSFRLQVDEVALDEDTGRFSISGPAEEFIMPGEAIEVVVSHETSVPTSASARIVVRSDDKERPQVTVPLSARPKSGRVLSVCRESFGLPRACQEDADLGAFRVGETRTLAVDLQSEGTEAVTVEGVTLTDDASVQLVTNFTAVTLAPGESVRLDIEVTPLLGPIEATLSVVSNTESRPLHVKASGVQVALCASPDPLDFGAVAPGDDRNRTMTFANCGNTAVSIADVRVLSDGFSLTEEMAMPVVLRPNDGLLWSVPLRFSPDRKGTFEGRIQVATAEGSAQFALRGRGASCVLASTPQSLEFAAQLGDRQLQQVEIRNDGTEVCGIDRVEPLFGELFVAELQRDLLPGESVRATVGYAPRDLTNDAQPVQVLDEQGLLLSIPAVGIVQNTPCGFQVSHDSLDFGAVRVGDFGVRSVMVEWETGTCALLGATTGTDFFVDRTFPVLLSADNPTVSLPIRFVPSGPGDRSTDLRVLSNANERSLTLGGSGFLQQLCVDPQHVPFGETGTTAVRQIALTACGAEDVQISNLRFTTADAEIDLPELQLPFDVAAGETVSIDVRYRPVDDDPDTAVLAIDANVSRTHEVRVTAGPEIVPVASGSHLFFWRIDPPGFGQAPQVNSDVMRIPLQGAPNAIAVSGPSATESACSGCHTLSPDGRFLAVIDAWYDEQERFNTQLSILDTTNGGAVVPEVQNVAWVSWRPDVNSDPPYQFVYAKNGDLRRASLQGDIGPVPGASSQSHHETMPSWGPNGKIVFVRYLGLSDDELRVEVPTDLVQVPEQGGVATPIPGASSGSAMRYYPRYSPDGQRIAFTESLNTEATSLSNPDARVRLISATGGVPASLEHVNGADGASSYPTWSPDGRFVSFGSNRAGGLGSYDLYLAPVDPNGAVGAPFNITSANSEAFEHAAEWGR